ncbi:MAG: PQQ-binding-like beta-propeller repeat protein [Chloroflexota bacterium]
MKSRTLVTIFFASLLILLVMIVAVIVSLSGRVNAEKFAYQQVWQQPFSNAQSMKIIDLNGDGQDDLFIQNADTLRILNADGSAWFDQTFAQPLVTSMGDVDGDGGEDVVALAYPENVAVLTLFSRGQEVWRANLADFGAPARLAVVRFPGDTQVIVGDMDGRLAALNASGAEVWRSDLLRGTEVRGLDDALVDGQIHLAAANRGGQVVLFGPQGQDVWRYTVLGGLRRLRAYDLNGDGQGEVLLGGETGRFLILNAPDGNVLVEQSLGQAISEIRETELDGDPASREIVAGGKDGGVWAYTLSGQRLWSASVGDKVTEIAGVDVDEDGAEEVLIGNELGNVVLFVGKTGARYNLLSPGSSIMRIDVGRLTASRQAAVADAGKVQVISVEYNRLPGFNFIPLLVGLLISLVIAVAAWFIATNPPKPAVRVDIQDQSPESLQAQRRMLKESIADVERLRQSGEMASGAYLARLKELRGQLADNETAMRQAGVSFTAETFQCPNCGGTLELGMDRCEYCGQVVIS